MPDFIPDIITQWIIHYGNFALFILLAVGIVGLPMPDETLIVFAGVLVAHHKLPFALTVIIVFLGSACGITMSYLIGRTLGNYLAEKYGPYIGITHEKIEKVHYWFDRTGKWSLFIGYFILGVRHLTGYVAGTTRVSYGEFALFAYPGALLWSQLFFFIGFFFSHEWKKIMETVADYSWYVLGVIAVLTGVYLLGLFIKRRYK